MGASGSKHAGGQGWRRLMPGLGRDNGLLFFSQLLMQMSLGLQWVLWPLYIAALGADPVQIGTVIGGAALLRTLLVIPAGTLADQLSTKPQVILTTAIAIPGGLVIALAQEWWHVLIGALLLETAGIGLPALSSYIARAARPGTRTRAYTMIYTVAPGIGLLVGPPIGGLLATQIDLRAVFVVNVFFYVAATVAVLRLHRYPAGHEESEADEDGSSGAAPSYLSILRNRGIVSVALLHAAVPLVLSIGTVLLPNFLEATRGITFGQLGTLGSLGATGGILISIVVGRSTRLGQPFVGMALSVTAMALAFSLFRFTDGFLLIGVAYFLRGAYSVVWSLMAAAVSEVAPPSVRGRAFGLAEMGAGVGDTTAPLMAGWLYATNTTLPLEVALIGCFPLLAAIAISALIARRDAAKVKADVVAPTP